MPAMLGMPLTLTLGAITVGLLIFIKLVKPRRETRGFSLPGPVSLPFVGSALSIRPSEPWVTYKEWGARYGDIFQMRIFSQNTIVINSEKIAKALLDQRSGIYSDRPYLATREPYGWSFHFAWEHYGERWRNRRRLFHQVFRAEAALEQRPLQLRKARQLVLDLLNAPSSYPLHIERFSTGIIMAIVYGYEIQPHNDPFVELFERGVSTAMEGLTLEMASVVATFPFVLSLPAWFPGAYIRRRADLAKQFAKEMLSEPVEYASKCVADGTAPSAMVPDLLRGAKGEDSPSRLQLIKEAAAAAFVGGSETSTTALQSFLLAMLQHPEVQERAQAEIDEVVGVDRMPNFDDRSSLPYVEAILRETMRFYPVTPLGVPHATTSDDLYEGYFIPKGTSVVANTWAMFRDEDIYPEPNSFKPERFFTGGKLDDDVPTSSIAYGFGRRICPGRYTADASIWVAMVSILSTLVISKARDDQGREIEVNPKFTFGVTSGPLPFPCSIMPRRPGISAESLSQLMRGD